MKRTAWVALWMLAALAAAGCALVDLAQPTPAQTLPPRESSRPTPTTLPPTLEPGIASAVERGAEQLPPAGDQPTGLNGDGPWLLYCDQEERAALMDVDGPGRLTLGVGCMQPGQVSAAAGLAVQEGSLLQFPGGDEIRPVCCPSAEWSADGGLALLTDPGLNPPAGDLVLYDSAADRLRPLFSSDLEITPLGLSPGGTWAVYLRMDRDPGPGQAPAAVMAVSTDGLRVHELYRLYDADLIRNSVLGWLSESTLLIQRSDYPCNLEPNHLELLYADLERGAARHLLDQHAYIAFDPSTQTILVEVLPREPCSDGEPQRGELVRLSAADGWRPRPVELPEAWGQDWAVSWIQWHPELGAFSLRVGENRGGAPLHLAILASDGSIEVEFPLGESVVVDLARLFPSPDGRLILVGAAPPHGSRLYDRSGRQVAVLGTGNQPFGYGPDKVLWMPEGGAFFATFAEDFGIYRAAEQDGWRPLLIEPSGDARSSLTLVRAPAWPFRHACDWADAGRQLECQAACNQRDYTRLQIGDRVMVSLDPPVANRLRGGAGLGGQVIDMLQPGTRAEIAGGPVCADGYIWWRLEPEGSSPSGWAAEGDAQGAWLVPVEGAARQGTSVPLVVPTAPPADESAPVDPALLNSVGAMDRLSVAQGWVQTRGRLLWTGDAGATWTDITPPGLPACLGAPGCNASVDRPFFLDASHAWLPVLEGEEEVPPTTLSVFYTDTGGRDWAVYRVAEIDEPGYCPGPACLSGIDLDFVDSQHGWLAAYAPLGNISDLQYLFRTTDGGRSWTALSIPVSGRISFADSTNGWAAGGGTRWTSEQLLRTRDAGNSWQVVSLAFPAPYRESPGQEHSWYQEPVFFSELAGVLPVRFNQPLGAGMAIGFYTTRDGGGSWSLAATLQDPELQQVGDFFPIPWSAIGESTWYVFIDAARQYLTRDAGKTWDTFPAAGLGDAWLVEVHFASVSEGWGVGLSCTAEAGCARPLFATHDGGRHWEPLVGRR